MLSEFNPHRFLHLNFLHVDPVSELNNFSKRLEDKDISNFDFHVRMSEIFQTMDDRHTVYISPFPLNNSVALLQFTVKQFFDSTDVEDNGELRPRYLVDIPESLMLENTTFTTGAEILTWNGEQINDFVESLGRRGFGSNPAAQVANAVQQLTIRILAVDLIPTAPGVQVGFRDTDGVEGTIFVPWVFFEVDLSLLLDMMNRKIAPGARQNKLFPFSRRSIPSKKGETSTTLSGMGTLRAPLSRRTEIEIAPSFQDLFSAEIIPTSVGPIGRLVLPSFDSEATGALIAELSRVLGLIPENGLIVDVRNNMGGNADYVKVLVELLTDKPFPDEIPAIVRATRLLSDIFSSPSDLFTEEDERTISSIRNSVRTAMKVGEDFTGPMENIFSDAVSERASRVYMGPFITLVDGLTYSAGDIFTLLQVDNNLSTVVGTSANVGAGGASTLPYSTLQLIAPDLLDPLPGGVDFTTAFRRFHRTGPFSGAIVENFGVKPILRYFPTFNDGVNNDCDLIEFLVGLESW